MKFFYLVFKIRTIFALFLRIGVVKRLVKNHSERWVRGLNQQFAKLSYGSNRTGGSNPPLSAPGLIAQLDRAAAF